MSFVIGICPLNYYQNEDYDLLSITTEIFLGSDTFFIGVKARKAFPLNPTLWNSIK